jgi:hypothetical protein
MLQVDAHSNDRAPNALGRWPVRFKLGVLHPAVIRGTSKRVPVGGPTTFSKQRKHLAIAIMGARCDCLNVEHCESSMFDFWRGSDVSEPV